MEYPSLSDDCYDSDRYSFSFEMRIDVIFESRKHFYFVPYRLVSTMNSCYYYGCDRNYDMNEYVDDFLCRSKRYSFRDSYRYHFSFFRHCSPFAITLVWPSMVNHYSQWRYRLYPFPQKDMYHCRIDFRAVVEIQVTQ